MQEKSTRKVSTLSQLERVLCSADSATWEIKLHLCTLIGIDEMSALFRASKPIRMDYLIQVRILAFAI
jgi:hypothetical protein